MTWREFTLWGEFMSERAEDMKRAQKGKRPRADFDPDEVRAVLNREGDRGR